MYSLNCRALGTLAQYIDADDKDDIVSGKFLYSLPTVYCSLAIIPSIAPGYYTSYCSNIGNWG